MLYCHTLVVSLMESSILSVAGVVFVTIAVLRVLLHDAGSLVDDWKKLAKKFRT